MKRFIALLLAGFAFVSCAPSTPQTRIQEHPEKFSSLGRKHQTLVREGQIARGMPPAAVELAWGLPDRRAEGSKNGQSSERWDYEGSRPVYTSSFFGGFGYGYGRYGRYGGRYSAYGASFGPDITYVPYTRASVWFVSDKVDAWEHMR